MAITTLNNRAINRSDTASADQVWTATSATASDFQAAASGTHTLLSTSTVSSAVSEVDISSNIDSTYKSYMIDIHDLKPATNASHLYMRFFQGGSVDTSTSYDSTSFYNDSQGSTGQLVRQDGESIMQLADEVGSDATETLQARIYLHNPSSTTTHTRISGHLVYSRGDNATTAVIGGRIDQTAAVDGVRFYQSSGNIDSCVIKLYGVT